MSPSDETLDDAAIAEQFRQFGLSDKEIDTYMAILDQGEAKASEIADETGVSKRYVYSISETLENRGFVDVNDHVVPTTIEARPPEEVIQQLTSDLQSLEPALQQRFSKTDITGQEFDVIKSRVTVIKRLKEYIDAATDEVTLTVPQDILSDIETELLECVERGVLTLVVVTGVDEFETADVTGLASVVRTSPQAMPVLLTVDNHIGLLAPAEMVLRSNSNKRSIAFVQEQLVPVLVTSFLGNYWPIAEEAYVLDPPDLPQTYESLRNAAFTATRYLREEVPVDVEASARPAAGGDYTTASEDDFTTITGRLVDTKQGLVEPASSAFASEHALIVETEDRGRLSIGGTGAFIEDYEARSVTLSEVEPE